MPDQPESPRRRPPFTTRSEHPPDPRELGHPLAGTAWGIGLSIGSLGAAFVSNLLFSESSFAIGLSAMNEHIVSSNFASMFGQESLEIPSVANEIHTRTHENLITILGENEVNSLRANTEAQGFLGGISLAISTGLSIASGWVASDSIKDIDVDIAQSGRQNRNSKSDNSKPNFFSPKGLWLAGSTALSSTGRSLSNGVVKTAVRVGNLGPVAGLAMVAGGEASKWLATVPLIKDASWHAGAVHLMESLDSNVGAEVINQTVGNFSSIFPATSGEFVQDLATLPLVVGNLLVAAGVFILHRNLARHR